MLQTMVRHISMRLGHAPPAATDDTPPAATDDAPPPPPPAAAAASDDDAPPAATDDNVPPAVLPPPPPPPLLGGYTIGETLYFTGPSHTFTNGDKLRHGETCEVVGPSTNALHVCNGPLMRFRGNKGFVECYLSPTSLSRAPPAPMRRTRSAADSPAVDDDEMHGGDGDEDDDGNDDEQHGGDDDALKVTLRVPHASAAAPATIAPPQGQSFASITFDIDDERRALGEDEIHDDPIKNVDDAPESMLAYFERRVKEIRGRVKHKGNQHERAASGSWPWKLPGGGTYTMWNDPDDPDQMPNPTPDDYKRLQWGRLLVWLPEFVYRRFFESARPPCKWHRGCCDCVRTNDFLNPMGPRMVVDSNSVFFIWCGVYECKERRQAGKHPYRFNGYDQDVLSQLPKNIAAKFPALLTRRSAISTSVIQDMISSVMLKMNFNAFRSKLYEAHRDHGVDLERRYTAFKETLRDQEKRGIVPMVRQTVDPYTHADLMYATTKKRGRFPSVNWLLERFHEWSDPRAEWFDRQMMMVDGAELSGDKSHKVTKLIFTRLSWSDASSKAFDGIFTLMNVSAHAELNGRATARRRDDRATGRAAFF